MCVGYTLQLGIYPFHTSHDAWNLCFYGTEEKFSFLWNQKIKTNLDENDQRFPFVFSANSVTSLCIIIAEFNNLDNSYHLQY